MSLEDEPTDQLRFRNIRLTGPESGKPEFPDSLAEIKGNAQSAFRAKANVRLLLEISESAGGVQGS